MLQAALYLAGDRRYEHQLRTPDVTAIEEDRVNNWDFYSDRRRRGFLLSTFQDLFGSDPAAEPLAALVARGLSAHASAWYNTQEIVWGVTGLGKRLSGMTSKFDAPVLTVNGRAVAPAPRSPTETGSDRTWALARASEVGSLRLRMSQPPEGKVFLVISSEGVRKKPEVRSGGAGLSVRREVRSLDGTVVDLQKPLQLGQLAFVEVRLSNPTREAIQNIALVDRLPAGLEIENPRLGRGQPLDWAPDNERWKPDAMNVRDDRMEVFGSLAPLETRTFVYGVRAVTAGAFTYPSIQAEAMYNPDIWAAQVGATVEVRGPWAAELL